MKLKYETGIATLIQFVTLSLLNVANGLDSIVTTCHEQKNDCFTSALLSMAFYVLAAGFFGCVWILGYFAQERRSKRLAQLLIFIELMISAVAFFNVHHHNNVLNLITSLVDLALAAWVILLAFRLMRSDGGRVVTKQRARHRKHTIR